MFTPVINDLQKGYAALRDLAGSQDTSNLGALTVSNAVLQTEVTGFKEKLLRDTRELPNSERILAAEYELLCRLASLNGVEEDRIISAVKMVEGGRIVNLQVGNFGLQDISPLAGLKALKSLGLDSNKISELSPLANLTKLKCLCIQQNLVTTLQALSGLTGLKELYVINNEVVDVSPLSDVPALETLALSFNRISDLAPLAGMKTLRTLYLTGNQVSDIKCLSALKNLAELHFEGNEVTDLSALLTLEKLRELSVAENPLNPDAKAVLEKLRAAGTFCHAPEGF